MLGLSFDYAACVLLASMSGQHVAADHERVYTGIEDIDRCGSEQGRAVALVFVVARDNVSPDAYWRRRFAEQRKTLRSPRVYLSVVTESAMIRGVLTAMNWIVPEPARMTSETHATFEACAAWIEKTQGTPRSVLLRLLSDARSSRRIQAARPVL